MSDNEHEEPAGASQFAVSLRTDPGALPGTIVVDEDAPAPVIRVLAYGPEDFAEATIESPDDVRPFLAADWPVVWVDVAGFGDVQTLQRLGELLELHPLLLEDVVNVHQRVKMQEFEDLLCIVMRVTLLAQASQSEQVSLLLGERLLVSFQERPGDCFDSIRNRVRRSRGKVRGRGPDYLAWALLDAITDAYFPVLEAFGEQLEAIEDETLESPTPETLTRIYESRRELLQLRRILWPMRECLGKLRRDDVDHISEETRLYFGDCYHHTVLLLDIVESYRELEAGLMDVYLSKVSHRMNEVMKVLTIVSTVFIPMTFVAGIYGMNFNAERSPWNMPELSWHFGYPMALLLMGAIAVGMLVYFIRKGWFGLPRT